MKFWLLNGGLNKMGEELIKAWIDGDKIIFLTEGSKKYMKVYQIDFSDANWEFIGCHDIKKILGWE